MRKLTTALGGYLLAATCAWAQADDPDTVRTLQEVIVQAYEYDRPALEVPASVHLLGVYDLNRFGEASIVSAVNTMPGVRMEERSPGSYRFSMRGSSLRAPFGVRNVKVYWNGLPLTDAGGNTYINQLEPALIREIEIIKGPGSSLYGPGTGGVLLLKGERSFDEQPTLRFGATGGSYGMRLFNGSVQVGGGSANQVLGVTHQHSDGYRDHTNLRRDVVAWNADFKANDTQQLSGSIFYSDLFYETPGGLNAAEFQLNPRQARPNADLNDASVHLRSLYTGLSHRWVFNRRWENFTGVFGNWVRFDNPSFRNVEHRSELHGGARSVARYHNGKFTINLGGEFEGSFIPARTYANVAGQPGSLQYDDELGATIVMLFTQAEWALSESVQLTGGLSYNRMSYHFLHLPDSAPATRSKYYPPVISPRLAMLGKLSEVISVFASVSHGFSPPSYAEVYPSEGTFNSTLKPETGINMEGGFKGSLLGDRLQAELSAFRFRLDETIVIRHDMDGAEYFVNAGATDQDGAEVLLQWRSDLTERWAFHSLLSGTLNRYFFRNYRKDADDYSGKQLTGVPGHTVVAEVDLSTRSGLYLNTTLQHTGKMPLNDANTVQADPYTLLSARMGYRFKKGRRAELFAGADNLTGEIYSLGYDLNAFGGRYYNTAPGRSFYAGLKMEIGPGHRP